VRAISIVNCLILTFLLALALPATAKEESKIKSRFDRVNGSGGKGNAGDVRIKLTDKETTVHVKARGLDSGTSYEVQVLDPDDPDAVGYPLRDAFSPGGNGSINFKIDPVAEGGGAERDPRGKYVQIFDLDAQTEVLRALIDATAGQGPPVRGPVKAPHIKEQTALEPASGVSGSAHARYDQRPNGKGRFTVQLRGAPDGDYELYLGGKPSPGPATPDAAFTPNSGGSAMLSFDTKSKGNSNGKSKGHNKKMSLSGLSPYLEWLEIWHVGADAIYYSGYVAAQIDGLNVCEPDPASENVPNDIVPPAGSVDVVFDRDTECVGHLDVTLAGATGDLSVFVDGALRPDTALADQTTSFSGIPGGAFVEILDGADTPYFEGTTPDGV
jgi:hypothetical protein